MSVLHLGRRNDSGELAGTVSEIASVHGVQNGRVVTAVRTAGGALKLISWQVSGTGPISRLADSGNQAGSATSIDIARGNRIVTACRSGSGSLLLISWDMDATGTIIRRGDSGSQAGSATAISIVAVTGTIFVTACRAGDGRLLLISWRLNADGTLTRLADSGTAAGSISEVSLVKLPLSGTTERLLTSVRDSAGNLKVIVWRVASTGTFARVADSGNLAGAATLIRSAVVEDGRVVTSLRDGSGNLKLISWGIASDGSRIQRLGDSGSGPGAVGDNTLTALSDGVVSGVRTSSGTLRLIGWTLRETGVLERRSDSGEQAGAASHISLVPVTGVAGVSVVTAVRTANGTLRLIAWGPACVRLHTKIVHAPTHFSVDEMVTAMCQAFARVGVAVQHVSTENLALPESFLDIEVGSCLMGLSIKGHTIIDFVTTEQEHLFSNRNNAGPNDVVVYFVRSTVPPYNGCAAHPAGRPSAIVAAGATRWTLGHEVGHVLGLRHVSDNDRLMTGNGTANITKTPPDLVPSEASTMQSSHFTVPA